MKALLSLLLALLLGAGLRVQAQVYYTRTGIAHFYSKAPIEDIEATNKKAECAFAPATRQISARIPMAGFEFDKSLMQRHFNENYLETDKYPYAHLEGKLAEPLPAADGTHPVQVTARLTLHGVAKDYTVPGQIEVKGGVPVRAQAKFPIRLEDHKIEIPTLVTKNLAEVVQVDVDFPLQPKTK